MQHTMALTSKLAASTWILDAKLAKIYGPELFVKKAEPTWRDSSNCRENSSVSYKPAPAACASLAVCKHFLSHNQHILPTTPLLSSSCLPPPPFSLPLSTTGCRSAQIAWRHTLLSQECNQTEQVAASLQDTLPAVSSGGHGEARWGVHLIWFEEHQWIVQAVKQQGSVSIGEDAHVYGRR